MLIKVHIIIRYKKQVVLYYILYFEFYFFSIFLEAKQVVLYNMQNLIK